MKAKEKAFGYLRTSGRGQIGNDGLPRQREAINRFAKANGIQIVQMFEDEGVTGTLDAMDRPGLTDLFVALKANGVRKVIVENPTRLARDLMISEIILAEFRKIEVKVISADGNIDLTLGDDNPTGQLVRQILGAISTWEKLALVQKTASLPVADAAVWPAVRGKEALRPHPRGTGHRPEDSRLAQGADVLR